MPMHANEKLKDQKYEYGFVRIGEYMMNYWCEIKVSTCKRLNQNISLKYLAAIPNIFENIG